MGISLRLLFLVALLWIGFILYSGIAAQSRQDDPDKAKVVMLFGGAVVDAVGIATLVALIVAPAIGQSFGSYLFNPGGEIAPDPHAAAIARLAQGDPEGAIEEYEALLRKDPGDTLALSEIARICCRDLGDTARAATVIERALDAEWPHEESSFLANRLADIYLLQEDPLRAKQVLVQIAEAMAGTKYAANAQHRLHDIDRSLENGRRASFLGDQTAGEDDPDSPEDS